MPKENSKVVFGPEFSSYRKLIIGSGSKRKESFARDLYGNFPGPIETRCPEQRYGVRESNEKDAVNVAIQKNNVIFDHLKRKKRRPKLVITGDVVTSTWKEGGLHDDTVFLSKISAGQDIERRHVANALKEQATQTALALYCNGSFYVVWHVGMHVRSSHESINSTVGLRIEAAFDTLPEDLVYRLTKRDEVLFDSTLVGLAELLNSKYVRSLQIRNRGEDRSFNTQVSPDLVRLFVMGNVLPNELFHQAIANEVATIPNYGTRRLRFSSFDILHSLRE